VDYLAIIHTKEEGGSFPRYRYAGSVSGVVTGKRETILGILEDLLRYHEGVKPGIRVKKEGGWEEPYLGEFPTTLVTISTKEWHVDPSYGGVYSSFRASV
jgi:hypothetical protein